MVTLTIIALCCGAFCFSFLVYELHLVWENIDKVKVENKGIRKITLLWKVPAASKPVLIDIAITMGVVYIFKMGGGQIGTLLALLASGFVSAFLAWKRLGKKIVEK